MPQIVLEDVTVVYKSKKSGAAVRALDGCSAVFQNGKFSVIAGFSGCGKTTLLKAVGGVRPYDGKIYFDGVDCEGLGAASKNIAYVAQDYSLYPHLTVFENIAFPLHIAGAKREEILKRVNSVAERLGLEDCLSRKPRHISGGQQQRVALARAAVKRPSVILLDEPLSNVEAPARADARVFLKKFLKEIGCTAVYVTHDLREAMAVADELFVMKDGKFEISGAPLEVYNSGNAAVKALFGDNDVL